ncbi:MAG: hypothetical protein AAF532_10390 [Planctomycetota bacterium]
MATRRLVTIAVRGLGTEWGSWVEPLAEFEGRVRTVAVSDAVAARRDVVARRAGAFSAPGLAALVSIVGLDGVLVCEAGLAGLAAAVSLGGRVPAVLLARPPLDIAAVAGGPDMISAANGRVHVAFRARYEPSIQRLMELIASRLGRPTGVSVRIDESPDPQGVVSNLVEAVDVAAYLAGTPEPGGWSCHGRVVTWSRDPDKPVEAAQGAAVTLICERGVVSVRSARLLRWQEGDRTVDESLEADRDSRTVILDLFLRRAAGGLVPLPTFDDWAKAAVLAGRLNDA